MNLISHFSSCLLASSSTAAVETFEVLFGILFVALVLFGIGAAIGYVIGLRDGHEAGHDAGWDAAGGPTLPPLDPEKRSD